MNLFVFWACFWKLRYNGSTKFLRLNTLLLALILYQFTLPFRRMQVFHQVVLMCHTLDHAWCLLYEPSRIHQGQQLSTYILFRPTSFAFAGCFNDRFLCASFDLLWSILAILFSFSGMHSSESQDTLDRSLWIYLQLS